MSSSTDRKKSGLSDYERDRISRLKQAKMRAYSPALPGLVEDPTNPGHAIPEGSELYPSEEGGAPTGVGADGTTPYSSQFWKQNEKRPPGKGVRERWEEAEQPEEAIPVTKGGQVKRLLQLLRRPQ